MICAVVAAAVGLVTHAAGDSRRVVYGDLTPPVLRALGNAGANQEQFDRSVAAIEADTARRVAEGDRDHLIYYALQSRRFTSRVPIEPALSARRFVERLAPADRTRLVADAGFLPPGGLPADERERLAALLRALGKPSPDPRLTYFRELVAPAAPAPDVFYPDYVRVARFLYKKEFVAPNDALEVARLYQTRPHSSDTQVDAGFSVFAGFGVVHALDPAFRATRVLVVGPGLDLAPRTDLIDEADPQSYQPLAVADALLSLSMASEIGLRVHSVDINPRVVRAVRRLHDAPVTWHVFSGLTGTPERPLSADYRDYVRQLGRSLGARAISPPAVERDSRYRHSIAVRPSVSKMFTADVMNVITERHSGAGFDAIVVTNVLPYLDDAQLALALANIAAMLRPGGYLIHNESRDLLPPLAGELGLPVLQMRTAVLGGPRDRPLYDVVWLHRRN